MIEIAVTLVGWAIVVLLAEFLWWKKILRGEYARKLIHILLSLSIAFLPIYLSWDEMFILAGIGMLALVFLRVTKIFSGMYDIERKSWGEFLGPLAIAAVALTEPSKLLFAAVVLHIGLADGLAAIIGTRYGRRNRYKVFGYFKSVAGTATFFVASLLITAGLIIVGDMGPWLSMIPLLLLLPAITTLAENIGIYGVDNALIALVTYIVFSSLV